MHEKLKSVGVIAPKYETEILSKMILDSEGFEVIDVDGLRKLTEEAEYYAFTLKLLNDLFLIAGEEPVINPEQVRLPVTIDVDDAISLTEKIKDELMRIEEREKELSKSLEKISEELEVLSLLNTSEFLLEDLTGLRFTKIIIGKIHKTLYDRFSKAFVDSDVYIQPLKVTDQFVYFGFVYPVNMDENVENLLKESGVKDFKIPTLSLTPKEAYEKLSDQKKVLEFKMEELELRKKEIFFENFHHIKEIYNEIFVLKNVYDVVKKCGFTEEFIVMKGWVTSKSLEILRKLQSSGEIALFEDIKIDQKKPTLLKNPKFFKPFEMLVKMYGIPRNDEVDPTPFVGILFLFFYGMMFGDVGHGGVISLLAYMIYKRTRHDLWYIMTFAGLSSAFFGILYGSIFGFEVIKPLFARPMENINLFLIISVLIGAALIILGMVLNVVNRLNRKEYKKLIYDPNGFAGLGLYLMVVTNIFWYIQNGTFLFPFTLFFVTAGFFIVLIFLYSVLFEEGTLGERITLAFFETFDRLLAFFSNTLSFIRLGAFAMNHAGLFLAFYIMARMSNSAFGSFISLLLGNLLLIFLEGLVVFIQAVRLEFYEFFSKFYSGDGREFKPVKYQQEVK